MRHWKLPSAAVVGILLAAAIVLLGATSSSAVEPLNALVPTTVEVPLALRDDPFDQDRVLMVPSEFKISVVARIPGARFIMPLSTGEILVAQPSGWKHFTRSASSRRNGGCFLLNRRLTKSAGDGAPFERR